MTTLHLGWRPDQTKPPPGPAAGNTAPAAPPGHAVGGKWLKVFTTLDATELLAVTVPADTPRVSLRIRLPDRTVSAEIAAKSLRKAQTAIRDQGADNIVLLLQGRLVSNDVIADAGLAVQRKSVAKAS